MAAQRVSMRIRPGASTSGAVVVSAGLALPEKMRPPPSTTSPLLSRSAPTLAGASLEVVIAPSASSAAPTLPAAS